MPARTCRVAAHRRHPVRVPHRNRVTPFGEIVAVPERGTLMGNRGVIHADDGSHKREWQVRRWIACRLEFKGRRRAVRQPRRWTELFFLDEATALAAGHRPCAECRREDYRRWQAAWPGDDAHADAMDLVLHADRLDGRAKRTYEARLGELPDGVMVERGGAAFLAGRRRPARVDAGGLRRRGARRSGGACARAHAARHGRHDRPRLRGLRAPVHFLTSAGSSGRPIPCVVGGHR